MWQDEEYSIDDKKAYENQKELSYKVQSYQGAINYCEGIALNGYKDWRLPKIKELKIILHHNKEFKHRAKGSFYGISSSGNKEKKTIIFDNQDNKYYGSTRLCNSEDLAYVRCVRNHNYLSKNKNIILIIFSFLFFLSIIGAIGFKKKSETKGLSLYLRAKYVKSYIYFVLLFLISIVVILQYILSEKWFIFPAGITLLILGILTKTLFVSTMTITEKNAFFSNTLAQGIMYSTLLIAVLLLNIFININFFTINIYIIGLISYIIGAFIGFGKIHWLDNLLKTIQNFQLFGQT